MQASDVAHAANRLIEGLPAQARRQFLAACEPVELHFAQVLTQPGQPLRHVFFPTGSLIALTIPVVGHLPLGVGIVGNEGMLGVELVLGADATPLQALVQGAGAALRMECALFRRELDQCAALQDNINQFLYAETRQIIQTAASNRFHKVIACLARWLLMTHDRTHANEFHLTHEFLAQMLGVRRVGITRAATSLQEEGLISYRRGRISILDRAGLERVSCERAQAASEQCAELHG